MAKRQGGSFAGIEGVGGSGHHAEAKPDPRLGICWQGSGLLQLWGVSCVGPGAVPKQGSVPHTS